VRLTQGKARAYPINIAEKPKRRIDKHFLGQRETNKSNRGYAQQMVKEGRSFTKQEKHAVKKRNRSERKNATRYTIFE